jgi:hypothetical protein
MFFLFINHFSALMLRARRASRPRALIKALRSKTALQGALSSSFVQTQKIYQKVMMRTFEVLAQCDENAGSLVATVALKEARQLNGLQDDERMTSFGEKFNGD